MAPSNNDASSTTTTPLKSDLSNHNPFDDPDAASSAETNSSSTSVDNLVLTVDRNATLTLGTDSLIVLDEGFRHRRSAATRCCGLLPAFARKTTQAIPYHDILWADLEETTFDLAIHFSQPIGRKGKACRVGLVNYAVTDKSQCAPAKAWVQKLLDRAYPPQVKRRKRIKVLVNPFGGTGNAQKLWAREIQPMFAAARCEVDVAVTTYRGNATEIAEKLDLDAYDVVACASGDGLPHEVFNGLAKRQDAKLALKKIAVVQLPCGSGNAMSLNLNGTNYPSLAAVEVVKGVRTALDLIAITQGDRQIYSFLSQAVGVIADTDLGTESLRWMGSFRFTWGILVRMLGQTIYPAKISVLTDTDDKRVIKEQYRNARQEHVTARSKNIPFIAAAAEDDINDSLPTSDLSLPPLKYGTINDPLPSTFTTTDMPQLGMFYVGNMCHMASDAPFFSCSLPSDGRMDLIAVNGTIPRTTCLSMLIKVEEGGIINFSEVQYSKVLAYRITPRSTPPVTSASSLGPRLRRWLGGTTVGGEKHEGLIAIDGERIPFGPFQAEIVPGMGTVLSRSGGLYEFPGPKG